MDQIGLNLNKLEQTRSNLIKMDWICLNLIKLVQTGSTLFKLDQIVSNESERNDFWGVLARNGFLAKNASFDNGYLARNIF